MITPSGSLITLSGTFNSVPLTANAAVSSIKYSQTRVPFTRTEFMHAKLLDAPNVDGSKPVINQLIGNRPLQYFTNCNANETARLLTPDDSDLDNIYKRFDTTKFEIVGDISLSSQIDIIYEMAQYHQVLLAKFDAHLEEARGNVSYQYLTGTLQLDALSYLTTTGLTMTGFSLGQYSPVTNLLITNFVPDVTHEYKDKSGTQRLYKTWSMTIENRVIQAAKGGTW